MVLEALGLVGRASLFDAGMPWHKLSCVV